MCKKRKPSRFLENYSWNILFLQESLSFVRDMVLFSDAKITQKQTVISYFSKKLHQKKLSQPMAKKKIMHNCL